MRRFASTPLPRKAALLLSSALLLGLAGFSTRLTALAAQLLPDFPNWITNGAETGYDYGTAVRGVGDVNGDSFEDVLVGAPYGMHTVYKEGAAYAFHGSLKGLKTDYDWIAGSGVTGANFGSALAGVGDVNGDTYDDVLVGAPMYNGLESQIPSGGAAFLFLGSAAGLQETPAWVVQGDKQDDRLGSAVDAAGDINHDGYLDLAVGVYHFTEGQENEGQVRVYLGSEAGFDSENYWGYASDQAGASLGAAVAGVGDLNGDGLPDLAATAPYYNTLVGELSVPDVGAVVVFYGNEAGLPASPDWMAVGASEYEHFGASVAAAGDLNQDGYDDLLVGVPDYDSLELVDEGAAYVYLGSADGLSATPAMIWTGKQSGSDFGAAVSAAGDINRDGYPDVAVGAPLFTQDQSAEGGVFVFFGKNHALPTEFGWRNFGQKADTLFGTGLGTADVNRDRCGDVLVGAPKFRILNFDVGRAVAFYGLTGLLSNQLFIPLVSK
jgi:hypothetical protein